MHGYRASYSDFIIGMRKRNQQTARLFHVAMSSGVDEAPILSLVLNGREAGTVLTVSRQPGIIRPLMNLILALACDEAHIRDDGKLDVTGIFNELGAPGFPAAHDHMTV